MAGSDLVLVLRGHRGAVCPCWTRKGQAAGAVIEGEPRLFGLGPMVMRGFLVHVRVQGRWLMHLAE